MEPKQEFSVSGRGRRTSASAFACRFWFLSFLLIQIILSTYGSKQGEERENGISELYEAHKQYIDEKVPLNVIRNNSDVRISRLLDTSYKLVNELQLVAPAKKLVERLLVLLVLKDKADLKSDPDGGIEGEDLKEWNKAKGDGTLSHAHFKGEFWYYITTDKSSIVQSYFTMASIDHATGDIDGAFRSYSSILKFDATNSEGILGRVNVYESQGKHDKVLKALTTAIDKGILDADILFRRGQSYMSRKNFEAARADFAQAYISEQIKPKVDNVPDNRLGIILHFRGIAERECGDNKLALKSIVEALKIGTKEDQAIQDLVHCYRELGDHKSLFNIPRKYGDEAKLKFASTLASVSCQMGKLKQAVEYSKFCLDNLKNDMQCLLLKAVSLAGLGKFKETFKVYEDMLALPASSFYIPNETRSRMWNRLESTRVLATKFLSPIKSYNIHNVIDGRILKNAARANGGILEPLGYTPYKERHGLNMNPQFDPAPEFIDKVEGIMREVNQYSPWIQLNTTGFLPNQRIEAAFGLSALQMSQTLRTHIRAKRQGGVGVVVPDSASSSRNYTGFKRCKSPYTADCPIAHHIFDWRDFFEIFVTLRQLAAPFDTVFWVDKFKDSGDNHGHTVDTNLMSDGYKKSSRYSSYYQPGFELMKDIILNEGFHSEYSPDILTPLPLDRVDAVREANTTNELLTAVGMRFYAEILLHSMVSEAEGGDEKVRGGFLILEHMGPHGIDFSIKFQNTEPKYQLQYQRNMDYIFESMVDALVMLAPEDKKGHKDVALAAGLDMYYYWVSYSPLSRGSSAGGYTAIYAILLAAGVQPKNNMPLDVQLDWESFYSRHPSEFKKKAVWVNDCKPVSKSLRALIDGSILIYGTSSNSASSIIQERGNKQAQITLDGVTIDGVPVITSDPLWVADILDTAAAITYVFSNLEDYR